MTKKMFAEFVGTFTLILLGAGSIITGKADLVGVALAHGLAIAIMVCAFAAASGAHFNPAVSFAMLITKRMNFNEFLSYVIAQLAGASVAAFILKSSYDSATVSSSGLGTPSLGGTLTPTGGAVVELIATFILVSVIFGVAVDKRGTFSAVAGLPIGFAIIADIMWAGPLTGAAMNPARWFGPALASGNWSNAWIWILGPIVGAALAAISYTRLVKPE